MAVRFPLYWDHGTGSLKSMTEAQRQEIVSAAMYEYGAQIAAGGNGVFLQYVSSGGTLGTITDQRFQAGAMTTHVSSFQAAQDKQPVTVDYDKISLALSGTTYSGAYPLYYDGGNIKHMIQCIHKILNEHCILEDNNDSHNQILSGLIQNIITINNISIKIMSVQHPRFSSRNRCAR